MVGRLIPVVALAAGLPLAVRLNNGHGLLKLPSVRQQRQGRCDPFKLARMFSFVGSMW
ncbi:hypothetical protein G4Y79_01070 [Phototrophicus methaneseepsis]|uniref:Uncharacterized protein n=1 Tax=Phototrophicus methaneseepsis TaxID=2710758 RepID=A0A7S8E9U5_9CHLR|nr:hypothetical protein [Phototrophicus methaneseepsis]QPC82997.1 hypothetical protein G4Y79_01070 [Phototrophicus methaneseepsis]